MMAEKKYWREENRTSLKDVIPLDTPYNIGIEVSSLCNARCVYCAHSKKDHGVYEGNMSMDLFYKVIDEIKRFPHKVKLIETHAFGEPLCNPNLEKMIFMINESGVAEKINFTTNGLLFSPQRIDALIDAGVDTIRVSLQGLTAEAYDKVCGVKMDYDKFLSNLQYLYEHRGKCKIRMKIADLALKDVNDGEKKFEEMFGNIADSIFVEHILPMFSDVNYEAVDRTIFDNAMNGRANIAQKEVHKVCHRPFYRLRITANGEVMANCCDSPHDIRYGNINEQGLVELWDSNVRKAFLKMQLQGKRFQHPVCKSCVLANDITSEADLLDPWAEEILKRF